MLIDDRDRAFCSRQTQKYCRLRVEVIKQTRLLKEQFLKGAFSLGSSKTSWKSLLLIGRYGRPLLPKLSVEQLNSYFASNFQNVPEEVPIFPPELVSSPLSVSVDEVVTLLRKLKNKSPAPDGIPVWWFRDFANVLFPAVAFIFNWSLNIGRVPLCFKVANVTPVPKCSPATQPSSFRPISLLPIPKTINQTRLLT